MSSLKQQTSDLKKRMQDALRGGGEKPIKKQEAMGKMTARERIIALLDDKEMLSKKESNTELIIFNVDSNYFANYQALAQKLRAKGINTDQGKAPKKRLGT